MFHVSPATLKPLVEVLLLSAPKWYNGFCETHRPRAASPLNLYDFALGALEYKNPATKSLYLVHSGCHQELNKFRCLRFCYQTQGVRFACIHQRRHDQEFAAKKSGDLFKEIP